MILEIKRDERNSINVQFYNHAQGYPNRYYCIQHPKSPRHCPRPVSPSRHTDEYPHFDESSKPHWYSPQKQRVRRIVPHDGPYLGVKSISQAGDCKCKRKQDHVENEEDEREIVQPGCLKRDSCECDGDDPGTHRHGKPSCKYQVLIHGVIQSKVELELFLRRAKITDDPSPANIIFGQRSTTLSSPSSVTIV